MLGATVEQRAETERSGMESQWPYPVSLDESEAPPIDPEAVPEPLRGFCLAVAEAVQAPFELAVMAALGAVAIVAQRKYEVQIRPGYAEALCLYILACLLSGERKSAVLDACKRPLVAWEQGQARAMAPEIKRLTSERRTREKAVERKRSKAGNARPEDLESFIREVQELEDALPEVPVADRLFIDDATTEAVAEFMARHGNRASVMEAEGGLFEVISGLYSNGRANLNLYLKSHNGESTSVDRRARDPLFVVRPTLTLCFIPQPSVLKDIAEKPGFRGRGLLARFLYCLPRSRLGSRAVETAPVPEAVRADYEAALLRVLDMPWATNEQDERVPYQIRLSAGAYEQWKGFSEAVEVELKDGGEFEALRDWAGKLPGQAARIAGLYHVATEARLAETEISAETMGKALALAATLADHARVAFSFMAEVPEIEAARRIMKWFTDRRLESFTARDAYQGVKGRFPKMEEVWPGLDVLEARAYIRPAEPEDREGRGRRPSPLYHVNPKVLED